MEYAIEVDNIYKKFKIYYEKSNSLKDSILLGRHKYENRQVLRGISFKVEKGQAIGLIGKNGCGKSTTLKLLTKIYAPDQGSIRINGRVSSLIELGAGFHPDMSGRENIYTNASIFGLSKREIDARMNQIIEFSELEEFIDNPVRTYSSGMYMRLAFSVAINVDAEVLLIDEILAVGDVNFQKKCFEKIREIKKSGTTIVIVSHSLGQIEELCDESIWIENGKIREQGEPKLIHEHYNDAMEKKRLEQVRQKNEEHAEELAFGNELTIRNHYDANSGFSNVFLENIQGNAVNEFNTNDDIVIVMQHYHKLDKQLCNISFAITRMDGVLCYSTNASLENMQYMEAKKQTETRIVLKKCNLLPGKYMLNVALFDENERVLDEIQRVVIFHMVSGKMDLGVCRFETEWSNEYSLRT
ncbi:putative uncharacterized protein [Roseburia sp. CAG:182]|nr:putative uncharacterized protein [Roseburia sp. CAG:182]